MAAPNSILELVERFERNRASYQASGYNETQLRREFLDPLFKALGWDVDNERGHAEAYKDVIHEDAIKVGGATKAPDYCFRIGGRRIFFLEAKKPSVNLRDDVSAAFQLRRYAWSAKLPLSILSDFEELAVYDCRVKPDKNDKPAVGRVLFFTYDQYVDRWDELSNIFSREAVLKGSFDKFAESTKLKRGTAEVDTAFLQEIESWRESLAKNFALRNDIGPRDLNFAVQRTIDRLIFLRMCEDRGIETYGQLMTLLNGEAAYRRLLEVYDRADERYNSGLFHFHAERGRAEPPDELTTRLALDDKPLKEIIRGLYYPDSPYEFSVLPAEILGQVYEQFLGKVIRLTAGGHRAVVEDKPEVKKAGGVFYTPAYIVDYIVRETVGKLVEGKTPKQVSKLRVLDPACGSGSFLVGAFHFLLDWHRDWYVEHGTGKHTKEIYQGPGGQWLLATAEKKRILLNNIYGVDIDSQAVEVTKLSLLLKVLEHENRETLERQLRLLHERALPDLAGNIKCGNSLIGPEFYDQRQMSLLDEEEQYRINAFDWKAEFPEIFKGKDAGFDAVIGNPPWGASFTEPELAYLRKRYARVISRMIDSYIYFIDRATALAIRTAPIGFIIPSTILNQIDSLPVRRVLLDRGVRNLVSLGVGVFGRKVLNTSTILVAAHHEAQNFMLADLTSVEQADRERAIFDKRTTGWAAWKAAVEADPHLTFFVDPVEKRELVSRIRCSFPPLAELLKGEIQRGVSPDIVAAHVLKGGAALERRIEEGVLRPSVSGSQIRRYRHWQSDQAILYTEAETAIDDFPRALDYLREYRSRNTCKEVATRKHAWWRLHRPRDKAIFQSPKFIGLTTTKRIEIVFDRDRSIYVTDAMYVFSAKEEIEPLALMAILHSRAFDFLYRVANQGESRVIPQVKATKLLKLPVPWSPELSPKWNDLAALAERILATNRQLQSARSPDEKTRLQRQVAAIDRRIDEVVYQLYGFSDAEVEVVEASPASLSGAIGTGPLE